VASVSVTVQREDIYCICTSWSRIWTSNQS